MSGSIPRLSDGYRRLVGGLRRKPARIASPSRRQIKGADGPERADGPPIRPRHLPSLARRLSGDSLMVVTVVALLIVVVTTLVIAVPASVDRLALQQRLAVKESRLALLERRRAAQRRFSERFTRAFMNPGIYKPAAARTAAFKPDGLEDEGELVRSMLWQLKSHRGAAHFLAGRKVITLRIDLSGDLPRLEWRRADSPVPGILEDLGIKPTERAVRTINIQINRLGFAALSGHGVIARDVDGRLLLLSEE